MPKQFPSSHKDLAPIPVRGWIFFCVGHMPSLIYLSTICKYCSTSSTSSYVCTHRHVGNSQKRHDIDEPKIEQERQMFPNFGPTFSYMSPTCRPTRQCRVKIANADIRQTQLIQTGAVPHKGSWMTTSAQNPMRGALALSLKRASLAADEAMQGTGDALADTAEEGHGEGWQVEGRGAQGTRMLNNVPNNLGTT